MLKRSSVIIITRNRPKILTECLDSLIKEISEQDEVIVVDSSTTDDSFKVVSRFPQIKYIRYLNGKSMPISRNMGIAESKGSILIFIDDDTIVQREWLKYLLNEFDQPDIGCVGGRVVTTLDEISPAVSKEMVGRFTVEGLIYGNHQYGGDQSFEVDFVSGCNMAYRKEVFEKAGGFDLLFKVMNDIEMGLRTCQSGYKVIFCPKALVIHKMVERDFVARHMKSLSSMFLYKRNYAYLVFKYRGLKPSTLKNIFYWDVLHWLDALHQTKWWKKILFIAVNIIAKTVGLVFYLWHILVGQPKLKSLKR